MPGPSKPPVLARPVMTDLGPTDRCSRCDSPEFVKPVAQIFRPAEVRHVYECPRCRHAWWVARDMAAYAGWTQGAAA